MSWWNDFTSGGYNQASQGYGNGINAVNGAYNDATKFMTPWWQSGMNGLDMYQGGINAMQNPVAFENNIMSQYQMSPQAQFQMKQGQNGMNAAAAAGGTLGSTGAMKDMDMFNQQVTNTDMTNFLNRSLGVNSEFLNNAGNLAGMGMNAGGQMGNWSMDRAADLAQLYGMQGLSNMYGSQSGMGMLGGALGGFGSAMGWF